MASCLRSDGGENLAEPKFEIFKDVAGQFRFRLRAPNWDIITTSEGYVSKQGCKDAVESVKKYAPIADVVQIVF